MIFNSWFFWALSTALIWGVGQVLAKKALDSLTPLVYNILSSLVGVPVFLWYGFSQGIVWRQLRIQDFLILSLVVGTYVLYYYIISLAPISLTGTILSTYPATTIILSSTFLKESLNAGQVFWIVFILLGVVLVGWPKKIGELKLERWFYLACLTAVIVGLADFVAKIEVDRLALGNYFFWYAFAFGPGVFLAYLLDRKGRVMPRISSRLWFWALLGALFIEAGNVFFFTAFSRGPVSLVSPVVTSYVALTAILAVIFLKEKLTKLQALGVALTVLGVVFLGS